jgi:hypothetical protein
MAFFKIAKNRVHAFPKYANSVGSSLKFRQLIKTPSAFGSPHKYWYVYCLIFLQVIYTGVHPLKVEVV